MAKIKTALISVSDKRGIVDFASVLSERWDIEIIATGNTANLLKKSGIPVKEISEITGFPEILQGRVKSIHPYIYGGILAVRDNLGQMEEISKIGIKLIDLVVVNLYPFKKVSLLGNIPEIIENIDIGGPSLLRAGAKNYNYVTCVCDPEDYKKVLNEMEENDGEISLITNLKFAEKVFNLTVNYEKDIRQFFQQQLLPPIEGKKELFPQFVDISLEKIRDLRYGENPHQKAAFYKHIEKENKGIVQANQIHGKELSFNNILDLDAAWNLVWEFAAPTVVIVKHSNPCGVGCAANLVDAYRKAFNCDPVSAFGGIVGINREIDKETAQEINKTFVECVIAPSFSATALEILTEKKNIRLLTCERAFVTYDIEYKEISGGFLVQEKDIKLFEDQIKIVSQRKPTPQEMIALRFAWKVCKAVKSNAIVFSSTEEVLGIGAGQMSRVDSVKIAGMKMKEKKEPLVMASDAFFPFPDGIEEAAKYGVSAVIQPGGSIRDEEIIKAVDKYNMAMVFTGIRHFKH